MLKNWFDRKVDNINFEDILINEDFLAISKTSENRFKLIYHHPHNENLDLYVIIEIQDNKEIEIITVYSFKKSRREHEKESR
ncbi:MAG: hypothetical protein LBT66_01615 [Methanobrevibacter sp.]|nr:hypothetical protein [Candidatus Methanovirga meridionalis]